MDFNFKLVCNYSVGFDWDNSIPINLSFIINGYGYNNPNSIYDSIYNSRLLEFNILDINVSDPLDNLVEVNINSLFVDSDAGYLFASYVLNEIRKQVATHLLPIILEN